MRIAYHPVAARFGRRMGHLGKRIFGRVLDAVLPVPENLPLDSIGAVQRILVVRPNFRIGNTLITTPLLTALQQRFPGASIDWLGGETTASLLSHLPIANVYSISRRFILRPWLFVALFARLRRQRYDLALEAGMGSFSGGLYTFLSGTRYRLGTTGKGDRFLNVRLPPVHGSHVYDSPVLFARQMGADCPDHPLYVVSDDERARAEGVLREAGVGDGPFAAVFVGGHQDKRWPAPQWLELIRALDEAGGRLVVFLGPEEMHFAKTMREGLVGVAAVIPPQPLRVFAAMWSMAALVITPDSGPMHLAAALGMPTVAILLADGSLGYRPRGAEDVVLMRPTIEEAVRAVIAHPRWASISDVRPQPQR